MEYTEAFKVKVIKLSKEEQGAGRYLRRLQKLEDDFYTLLRNLPFPAAGGVKACIDALVAFKEKEY